MNPLKGIVNRNNLPPTSLTVAEDIAGRLLELREHLGENQEDFAARFGRGWKQASAWENGRQTPRAAMLERAAIRNGWPVEIFADGGPRPKASVKAPSRLSGPRSEVEWWLDPQEVQARQRALLEMLAKFRQETAAYRAAGLVPGAEKVLEWLERMERAASLSPLDPGSKPGGPPTPPEAGPTPR